MGKFFLRSSSVTRRSKLLQTSLQRKKVHISKIDPTLTIVDDLTKEEIEKVRQEGFSVIPSRKFSFLFNPSVEQLYQPLSYHPKGMNDVLDDIFAREAWDLSKGEGTHIAIIDTGIHTPLCEFPKKKQSTMSPSASKNAWTDIIGHGTMVASIAGATDEEGARYSGVAPKTTLISCKTSFDEAELYEIYEHLITLVDTKRVHRLVINNSYGFYSESAPETPDDYPLMDIIKIAVERGIVVVFAAGNNHVKVCKNDPRLCSPNSIWDINSLDEVITVGTVDENYQMCCEPKTADSFGHRDSSRGPGQLSVTKSKPDCVAPTYGEVMWGGVYHYLDWWGTSGAAPQVSGLAALLLAKDPNLTPADVKRIIKESCTELSLKKLCVGSGMINCRSALEALG
ncbi:S8 family peptidase [Candidatus Uabimicrobium amorphum]|uniref:Serine protease AprX n=1 Tax=Uabimicrobium amorphum TaxID=2596890 RepID=A0A5S9F3H2_UABAM|nr:S8/S53 family peptidase [Candidatus Uabimicrobium amorphum]BBM84482.1 serine protease AprX [Candidatus Uabimicrobium amorphum]